MGEDYTVQNKSLNLNGSFPTSPPFYHSHTGHRHQWQRVSEAVKQKPLWAETKEPAVGHESNVMEKTLFFSLNPHLEDYGNKALRNVCVDSKRTAALLSG